MWFYNSLLVFISISIFGLEKIKAKKEVEKKIKELENRKREIVDSIRKVEQDYFHRLVDENTFKQTVQSHRQEIMEIDLELKKLSKKINE